MNDARGANSKVDPLLVATACAVFADLVASGSARSRDGEWAADAWRVVADTGLTRVGVPESIGGEGGSNSDAAAILGLAGQYALPLPIAENALLAGWLLASAGLHFPTGSGPVVVAPGRPGDTLVVEATEGGWTATGIAQRVPWAHAATHVVLLAPLSGHDATYAVATLGREHYDVVAGTNLAGERRDTIVLTDAMLPADAVATSAAAPFALARRGAVSRCVLISGALTRVLALTVGYANTREQFGRPIATFQAVGHLLARLAEEAAVAEIAAALAVRSLVDEPVDADDAGEAAIAKSSCGRAAGNGARLAHQIHGAMGVTQEYELQRLTRRLLSWRDEYGSETTWENALGANLLASGAGQAWDIVIGARASLAEGGGVRP